MLQSYLSLSGEPGFVFNETAAKVFLPCPLACYPTTITVPKSLAFFPKGADIPFPQGLANDLSIPSYRVP
ncbi:MAG TPA: hypothetical protein PLK03_11335 [Termitinemataceae bacterium]|nr:hypothetical protein [Termitinemataceae bacterium]